jgi:hypothetical protein
MTRPEQPAALRPFLPSAPGHVIVTSRNPDWRGASAGLAVAEFARAESVALLQERLPDLPTVMADELADALGDLPLAVDQAANLLADTGMTPQDYLRQLTARTATVLSRGHEDPRRTVTASWAVAFDQLASDDPAALELLTLVAWLAPEPVPLRVITEHPELLPAQLAYVAADPLALVECTATLRRRGMARITPNTVELHRVPLALLRARTVSQQAESWASIVVRVLHAAMPDSAWNNPPVWPQWRPLLPHIVAAVNATRDLDNVVNEVTALLRGAGDYVQSRGEPRAARPLFERAYTLNQGRLDADDPDMLDIVNDLAIDLRMLGEYEHARALDEDTLARCRRVLGDDHSSTLAAANNLANDLRALGQHQQARALAEDTLRRKRRALGEDHPNTLTSAINLAYDLRALGEYQQARALDQDTLVRKRRVLGEDHPDTLTSANSVANDLRALGQYQQALDLDEHTHTRRQRVLGNDHPDTLTSANNLAADLRELGQYQEAHALDEDTLTRRRRILGDNHPDTLGSANNLGADLRELGEYQQARALDEDTLARRRRILGDDHPNALNSANNLAADFEALGEDRKAAVWREWATRSDTPE